MVTVLSDLVPEFPMLPAFSDVVLCETHHGLHIYSGGGGWLPYVTKLESPMWPPCVS